MEKRGGIRKTIGCITKRPGKQKTILVIATLDTKGPEAQYIKELIETRGHTALIMDIASLGSSPFSPNITAEEVARAAGSTIQIVRGYKEAGPAAEVMTSGATRIARELYNSGQFHGVISIGGSMGSSVASAVMRELPIGVPKFMLSSQKIVQAGIKYYVGNKDIAVMPSVADIAGLNRLTRKALSNAVGAIVGMVESPELEASEKPLIFMTMLGTTTTVGLKVKSSLEDKGFEVVVFHTVGIGGMTFEEMIKSYPVKGVIELGLNEIGNELFGGFSSAGPNRLETAGKRGIPQIITPGNVDSIAFLGPETVPPKYKDRNLIFHSPQGTAMRLNAEEMRLVAEAISEKLNQANGAIKILIPTRGFSAWDQKGRGFYDPAADKVFIDTLKMRLNSRIQVREIDAHINDIRFADTVVEEFLQNQ